MGIWIVLKTSVILFKGGGDAARFAAEPDGELALLVNRNAFAEVLGFEHIHFEQAVQDQVIDLGDSAIVFQAQVVDHDAVFVRPAIEVDVVGGFAFTLHARPHELQFPFDERLFVWRHAGVGKQGGEFGKVDALGVGFFQDHGQGLF